AGGGGVRGRGGGGAVQRRLRGENRAGGGVFKEIEGRGPVPAGHGHGGEHGERPDAEHRVVGLPAGLRGRPGRQGAQDRDPHRQPLRRLLRPGHQQDGSAPRRRPAVGGVPVLHRGPEPVAGGGGAADRAAHADQRQDRQRDGLPGAAAGTGGRADVPEHRSAERG